MSHHHDHHSENHNTDKASETISFEQKAKRLLSHWIHHNDEHAQSYLQWAEEFRHNNLIQVSQLLEAAVQLTTQINHALREAERHLEKDH